MIGCIATAPATGRLTTADPGDHGSNMDHTARMAFPKIEGLEGPLR